MTGYTQGFMNWHKGNKKWFRDGVHDLRQKRFTQRMKAHNDNVIKKLIWEEEKQKRTQSKTRRTNRIALVKRNHIGELRREQAAFTAVSEETYGIYSSKSDLMRIVKLIDKEIKIIKNLNSRDKWKSTSRSLTNLMFDSRKDDAKLADICAEKKRYWDQIKKNEFEHGCIAKLKALNVDYDSINCKKFTIEGRKEYDSKTPRMVVKPPSYYTPNKIPTLMRFTEMEPRGRDSYDTPVTTVPLSSVVP